MDNPSDIYTKSLNPSPSSLAIMGYDERLTKGKFMYDNYQLREIAIFNQDMQRIKDLPLSDRKENAQTLKEFLESDELRHRFSDSIHWLLHGSMGHGAYIKAQEVIGNKRMNQGAWIFQVVSSLEFGVPQRESCKVWNSLSKPLQDLINKDIEESIEHFNKAE